MRRRNQSLARIVALTLASCALTAEAFAAELLGVRFGVQSADATRIVVDLNGAPAYKLSGDPAGDGTIILELEDVDPSARPASKAGGLIGTYSVASVDGDARIALTLKKPVSLTKAFVIAPSAGVTKHRLVIDVAASTKAAFEKNFPRKYNGVEDIIVAATEEAKPPRSDAPSTPRSKPAIVDYPTIFIDAGHGGGDPGAIGQKGTKEKTVTLAAAKELADILKARGRYKIVMTRTDDSRFSLVQRTHLARKAAPDLFITIHADAHKDPTLSGGSVYTVSSKGVERSAREAKSQKNVRVGDLDMDEVAPELGEILYDFAQRETVSASTRFARSLVKRLKGVTPLLNNTHRQGNLFLLLAPDVPAVLLELAFISNIKDEA
ncbi:MAG: N-acetylmuramoyl-L-alanine amidase, partial [Pseudomonadota bacterium]